MVENGVLWQPPVFTVCSGTGKRDMDFSKFLRSYHDLPDPPPAPREEEKKVGALKHGNLLQDGPCMISPLYRLETAAPPLNGEGRLLGRVKLFLSSSEKRGSRLWQRLRDREECTSEDLLRLLEELEKQKEWDL